MKIFSEDGESHDIYSFKKLIVIRIFLSFILLNIFGGGTEFNHLLLL